MPDIKIKEVLFCEDYQINILLNNGHRIIYNLKPKLVTARFQELSDWENFCCGSVIEGKSICWRTGAELSLDEILLNIYRNME